MWPHLSVPPKAWKFMSLLVVLIQTASPIHAVRECHQCSGINCLRTNYAKVEACENSLDVCATIYEAQTLLAQGCFEQIPIELRAKCNRGEEAKECYTCNEDLCNNVAIVGFQCLQCDSKIDKYCRSKPSNLFSTRCPVSRASNAYCFIKDDGQRTTRGCSTSLVDQKQCLSSSDCQLCLPTDIFACNSAQLKEDDSGSGSGDGSGDGGSGSGDGGSGSGNGGSGSGDGGSGSGDGSGDGNGNGDGGSGSGDGDGGSGNGNDNGNGGHGNNIANISSLSLMTVVSSILALVCSIDRRT